MDIYLKKAILHIIDRETGTPVFSEKELDLTTEYIRTYLTAKISKLSTAQTKTGTLAENSSFVDTLRGIPSDFVKKSQVYNKKEVRDKKENKVAAELNLTRFDQA